MSWMPFDPQNAPQFTPPSFMDGLRSAIRRPGVAQALMQFGAQLMAGGAPSTNPGAAGQGLGSGMSAFAEALRQSQQDAENKQYRGLQMDAMKQNLADAQTQSAQREQARSAAMGAWNQPSQWQPSSVEDVMQRGETQGTGQPSLMETLPAQSRPLFKAWSAADPVGALGAVGQAAVKENDKLLNPAEFSQALQLRAAGRAPQGAQSAVGKAADDLAKGLIDKPTYDAIVKKAININTPQGPLPSVERDITLPILQKQLRGETLNEREQAVLESLKPNAAPAANDPNVEVVAKAIANYQQAPLTNFVMRTPYGQAVMAKVYENNPEYRAQSYNASNKAQSAFATGKQGDAVRSFNVVISHLNTLDKLTDALNNRDVQALNQVSNAFKQQFGSPAPTNFNAAKAIVGDEIIKAIVAGGGALADRENAQNQINAANTPAQLKGVIKTYKELMAGQLKGLKKQYEDTTFLRDFDERLAPETRSELEAIQGGAAPSGKTGNPLVDKYLTAP